MTQIYGIVSAILNTFSYILYIRSILRGTSKPSVSGWCIWTVLHWVTTIAYWYAGATDTLWSLISSGVCSTVVWLLASRRGYGDCSQKIQPWECICILASAILAVAFHSPLCMLIGSRVIHCIGAIKTFQKLWHEPKSEDIGSWVVGFAGKLFHVAAITEWTVEIAFYPVYMLGVNVIITTLTLRSFICRTV